MKIPQNKGKNVKKYFGISQFSLEHVNSKTIKNYGTPVETQPAHTQLTNDEPSISNEEG